MANTYSIPSGYDVGCDDCGAMDHFESGMAAREWRDEHVCQA